MVVLIISPLYVTISVHPQLVWTQVLCLRFAKRLLAPGIPSFVLCMCADLGERGDLAVKLAIDG